MQVKFLKENTFYTVASSEGILEHKCMYVGQRNDKYAFMIARNSTLIEALSEKEVLTRVCLDISVTFVSGEVFNEGDYVMDAEGVPYRFVGAQGFDQAAVRTIPEGKLTIVDLPLWYHPIYKTKFNEVFNFNPQV